MNNYLQSINEDYDNNFVFVECGFDWLPASIDRGRLFNVAYDLQTGAVKLYFLDPAEDKLLKVSGSQIETQYLANSKNVDAESIYAALGLRFDLTEIVPDTVEGDNYYLYLEPSGANLHNQFLTALAKRAGLTSGQLLERINSINQRRITGFTDAHKKRALSLVRL
jgi:hypothetical protein